MLYYLWFPTKFRLGKQYLELHEFVLNLWSLKHSNQPPGVWETGMLAPTPRTRIEGRAIHCLPVAVPSWPTEPMKHYHAANQSPTCSNCCWFYDWFVDKSHIFTPFHTYSHYLLSAASDRKQDPRPVSLVHYPLLGPGQKPHALEAPCLPRLHRIW